MSIKIMQEVWDNAPVETGTLLVLLALADSADERSRTCYPGVEALAHRSRLSDRQVQRAIKGLGDAGIISIKRNASPVKTNLYRINDVSSWKPRYDNMSPQSPNPETTSATPRYDTHVVSDTTPMSPEPSVTSVEPSDSLFPELKSDSQQIPSSQKKQTQNVDQDFETFWSAYPRDYGKALARKKFQAALKKATAQQIIDGAKGYAKHCADEKTETRFMKHASTWLNQECWTDHEAPRESGMSRIDYLLKQAQIEDQIGSRISAAEFRRQARELGWEG